MEDYEASLEPEQLRCSRFVFSEIGKALTSARQKGELMSENLDRLMEGSIDVHIHAGPDAGNIRRFDEIDVAIRACNAKMKAIVFKQAFAPTACRAPLVQKVVNQWAQEHNLKATKVIGGVALNMSVGGLNPQAVVGCARYGGKFVWLPVSDSSHHRRVIGETGGIEVVDKEGRALPELLEILKIIIENDLVLVLSHQSTRERWKILQEAKKLGAKRILVDHPQESVTKMTLAQMREFAEEGAYFSMTWMAAVPNLYNPWTDPREIVEIIRKVGVKPLVAGTDLMQAGNPDPVEGLRFFMEMLLVMGISVEEIRSIFSINPTKLIFE